MKRDNRMFFARGRMQQSSNLRFLSGAIRQHHALNTLTLFLCCFNLLQDLASAELFFWPGGRGYEHGPTAAQNLNKSDIMPFDSTRGVLPEAAGGWKDQGCVRQI
jgi:hypothetical protein